MEPFSPVAATIAKVGVDALQRNFLPLAGAQAQRQSLDPPVSVELSGSGARASDEAEKQRYVRDTDSKSLVFQVTDPVSGDIIIQIPNEVVIKARAYARQPEPPVGERLEKTV